MGRVSRRNVLTGAASAAAAAGVTAASGAVDSSRATAVTSNTSPIGPVTIGPDDPRYPELTSGMNRRWVSQPDYIRMVNTTSQVVEAVQESVDNGKRISVQGGGHCYANFVHNPEVKVVINMSEMKAVYLDKER